MTRDLPLIFAAAIWLAVLPPLMDLALRRVGLVRRNYRDEMIPVAFGVTIVLWAAPILLALRGLADLPVRPAGAYLAVIVGFGGLGLLDDLFGSRKATGLRGHLGRLFRQRELTTGLVKAVGGLAIGIVLARAILSQDWPDALLNGILVALSANLVNLLDLRPGRAGAFFLLCAALLIASSPRSLTGSSAGLLVVVIPALLVYQRDRRGSVMMGDTGSNLLGGALGLAYLLRFPSFIPRLCLLAGLILIHLAAERFSFTALIERNPALRWLDARTGER